MHVVEAPSRERMFPELWEDRKSGNISRYTVAWLPTLAPVSSAVVVAEWEAIGGVDIVESPQKNEVVDIRGHSGMQAPVYGRLRVGSGRVGSW